MSRDEAVKIMSRIWGGNPQHDLANSYVDAFVALGMLKLDVPKCAEHRFIEVINNLPLDFRLSGNIWSAINDAGLKIVEK